MAGLADIGGIDVRRALAAGRIAIVTTDAVSDDRAMVYGGPQPLISAMARIAFERGRHMGCAHTRSNKTIMTT